ncbi:hypothetical protein [Marinobacter sp. LV10R520-4]|nr:hypothetical protein [Marinobacter sp. LV10R520-4]
MTNTIEFGDADILFTDVDDTLTTEGRLLPETSLSVMSMWRWTTTSNSL